MEHTHLNKLDPNKYFEKYISNINLKKDFKGKKMRWKPLNIMRFLFFENLPIIWSQAQKWALNFYNFSIHRTEGEGQMYSNDIVTS